MKTEKKRQRDRMVQIEKLKKRREQRLIEKAQHEDELAVLARERARAKNQDGRRRKRNFTSNRVKRGQQYVSGRADQSPLMGFARICTSLSILTPI